MTRPDELSFAPLGGVGEIGMNLSIYGFGPPNKRQWLAVDVGVSFAADEGLRFTWRSRLNPLFEAVFARRTLSELAPLLDGAGVTHGAYQALSAAVAGDPRLAANLSPIDHPSGHRYPTPGVVADISSETRGPPVAAPRLGQHTDEVLSQRLGLSSAEIARLHDQGLVAGA